MPVLLLAQGDSSAKELLKQAISARYGLRPPAIESLTMQFKGRARAKIGPVSAWVPVDASAHFVFPTALRWDFAVKPIGVEVQRGVEAFDGSIYRRARGSQPVTAIDTPEQISSVQGRLWAIAAMLLTPLGEAFVRLNASGDHRLEAVNTRLNNAVQLQLRENYTLECVQVTCANPDNDRVQRFSLRLSAEQAPVDELMLPKKISAFWDDDPYFEAEPMKVELNPTLAEDVFTLSA